MFIEGVSAFWLGFSAEEARGRDGRREPGGFQDFWHLYPDPSGNDPSMTIAYIFQLGWLVQPPRSECDMKARLTNETKSMWVFRSQRLPPSHCRLRSDRNDGP